MSLDTSFSITPKNPTFTGTQPISLVRLVTYGGLSSYGYHSISNQFDRDEITIYCTENLEGNNQLGEYWKGACARITCQTRDLAADKQLLLIIKFYYYGTIQVFVGDEMVREEVADGQENVAILMDSPGSGYKTSNIFIRPASVGLMRFQGVDGYVI